MSDEVKFKIGEQWYYRGNRSPQWLALASRPGSSSCGIADKVPAEMWPILEELAKATAELDKARAANRHYENILYFPEIKPCAVPDGDDAVEIKPQSVGEIIAELDELKYDIARHVQIATGLATELAAARKEREGCAERLERLANAAAEAGAHIRSSRGMLFPSDTVDRAEMLVELEAAISHAAIKPTEFADAQPAIDGSSSRRASELDRSTAPSADKGA